MKVKKIAYNEDIICPYCNKVLVTQEDEDYEICSHTIFIDADGFVWIRDDLTEVVKELFSDSYDAESLSRFPYEGTLVASEVYMGISVYWGFIEKVDSNSIISVTETP